MVQAIQQEDFRTAQWLATTPAQRELFVQEQRAHAQAIVTEQLTGAADQETDPIKEQ